MEALQIISQSWPIAAMIIALLVTIGINSMIRMATKSEDERVLEYRIQSNVQRELARISQMKTVDDNG